MYNVKLFNKEGYAIKSYNFKTLHQAKAYCDEVDKNVKFLNGFFQESLGETLMEGYYMEITNLGKTVEQKRQEAMWEIVIVMGLAMWLWLWLITC